MKKILLAICLSLVTSIVFADTCPSVTDIKNHAIKGWKVYDSEDGKPLSAQREAEFVRYVDQFALVEWADQTKKSGTIHCFYRDKTGSALEAYLAKDNFSVSSNKSYWYPVSGSMECAAGADKCTFENAHEPKLANN